MNYMYIHCKVDFENTNKNNRKTKYPWLASNIILCFLGF